MNMKYISDINISGYKKISSILGRTYFCQKDVHTLFTLTHTNLLTITRLSICTTWPAAFSLLRQHYYWSLLQKTQNWRWWACKKFSGSHHDGMGQVAVRLALKAHGAQLRRDVALRSGNVQRRSLDLTQLGCHVEGQHTLDGSEHYIH